MFKLRKSVVSPVLISILAIGLLNIKPASLDEREGGFCCNNLFPQIGNNPTEVATMHCDGNPYYTNCNTCARYWSAYVEIPNKNPIELCDYLPYGEEPPLPDVPVPGNFNVDVTDDDHPQILWTHYYVHEYRIERKMVPG